VNLKKIIESTSFLLIDVRTKSEYAEGHIPGSYHVDFYNPEFEKIVKSRLKGKSVALYCLSGRRSKRAASKLKEAGIEIYELNNGFLDWQQSGLSVVK
jgi:rhodanese-related sulfurtransferase